MYLKDLIENCIVHDTNFESIKKLKTKIALAKETGFTYTLRKLEIELCMQNVLRKLGNLIILKPPLLEERTFYKDEWIERVSPYDARSFILSSWMIKENKSFLGLKKEIIKDAMCLFEISPDRYKENVPINILKATLLAKQFQLVPKVWFISELSKFYNHVTNKDPAIVAYPTFKSGNDVLLSRKFAFLIGLWGKDIEEISKIFDKKR